MISEASPISIGLVVVIIGALFVLYFRIEAKFGEAKERADLAAKDLGDYKLHVERHFVTGPALEKTEERLILAVDKLTARIETLVGRIENLGTRLAEVVATRDRD
jgi:hypothetical protein